MMELWKDENAMANPEENRRQPEWRPTTANYSQNDSEPSI